MGDVGSSFLGFLFAVLALYALKIDFKLFLAWIICLGVFIVDATFTIIRRILRGEKNISSSSKPRLSIRC